jgi:hypothetical protein
MECIYPRGPTQISLIIITRDEEKKRLRCCPLQIESWRKFDCYISHLSIFLSLSIAFIKHCIRHHEIHTFVCASGVTREPSSASVGRFRACLAAQAAVVLSRSSLKLEFRSPCCCCTGNGQSTGYVHAYRALMHAGRTDSIHRLFVGSSCFSSLDSCCGWFHASVRNSPPCSGCLWIPLPGKGEGSTGHIA